MAATPTTTSLNACPATPHTASSLDIIHRGGQPDDLAVDPAGSLWITDVGAGSLTRIAPATGAVQRVLRGFASPEGVVPAAGGNLLVAEQTKNRIVTVQPDGSRDTFLQLPAAPAGTEGVDGLGDDGAGLLLIPDSPHGTLLSTPTNSGVPLFHLASGLGRPVGAATLGSFIYVVAEDAAPRGLLRVPSRGGAATPVGRMAQLDDIVVAGGLLYVTDLAAHAVRAVDPNSGDQRTVASGVGQPQGLAVLPDGRLAVADSDSGRVLALPPCGS